MIIEYKKRGRKSKKPNDEMLAMLYCSMSAADIAKKYDVAEQTVRNWIAEIRRKGGMNE